MRPENLHNEDIIDNLLEKSWENPSARLEHQLMIIPAQVSLGQNRYFDRITLLLNTILLGWGVGLIVFFWTPLDKMIVSITRDILGFGVSAVQFSAHPVVALIVLASLVVGWVLTDGERHSISTRV